MCSKGIWRLSPYCPSQAADAHLPLSCPSVAGLPAWGPGHLPLRPWVLACSLGVSWERRAGGTAPSRPCTRGVGSADSGLLCRVSFRRRTTLEGFGGSDKVLHSFICSTSKTPDACFLPAPGLHGEGRVVEQAPSYFELTVGQMLPDTTPGSSPNRV